MLGYRRLRSGSELFTVTAPPAGCRRSSRRPISADRV